MIAARILADNELMSFFDEMRADFLTCIGNSQPTEGSAREELYYRHKGLIDLTAYLLEYKTTAEQIIEREASELAAEQPNMDTD